MPVLKPKNKKSKYEFELDSELVVRLRKTLKHVKEVGDVELPINQEVQRFLTKTLDTVDKELAAIGPNKSP